MWHPIRVSTVCKCFNRFSLGISKSDSWIYLKLKLDSFYIQCRRVYSVYNGLKVLVKIFERLYLLNLRMEVVHILSDVFRGKMRFSQNI